jgi:uncharacterized protein
VIVVREDALHRKSAVERGGEAHARGDYAAAFREWSVAASAGDPEGSYRLGLIYARGHGVIANFADAAANYQRAAEQGHAEAQYQLSLLYLADSRADLPTSFARWYRAAAECDKEAAERNRALLFPNGLNVPPDAAAALHWSRAAAEHGIADAQANTGLIYARGVGCERDYQEARRWYELAAAQGSAAAELGLGILYANGHGVEKDLATAASWYRKAAEKSNASAQVALGLMYLSGQGVDRDLEKAAELFRKASEQGDARARYNCLALRVAGSRATQPRPKPCSDRPPGKGSSRRCFVSRSCTRPRRQPCRI